MATKQPPPQKQGHRPGHESEMAPQPESEGRPRRGSGKLKDRVVIITGVDSGIGRAVAIGGIGRAVAIAFPRGRRGRHRRLAPGPIWTPPIPSTFPPEKVAKFGQDVPMGRPGQPEEVAACFVFLASEDSSYISGQILHPNGGKIVNG